MSVEDKIIGVDLDGVCCSFYSRMREIAAEWFECSLEDLTAEVSYGLPEWGIKSDEEYQSLHRFAVTQRDLFKTSQMIPGARRYLRELSNEGARMGARHENSLRSLIGFGWGFLFLSDSL